MYINIVYLRSHIVFPVNDLFLTIKKKKIICVQKGHIYYNLKYFGNYRLKQPTK